MPRSNRFKWKRTLLPFMHKVTSVLLLAALLAGLLPPPLVSSALNAALPEAVAQPVVKASQALLPAPKVAQAAAPAPVAAQKTQVASAPAAPAAKPLGQGIAGNNVLTITKTVLGTASGPFNITVNGPSGYLNQTTITPGTPVVLQGLASGVYVVTETPPGAGWTTVYTATPGLGGNTHAVVKLRDENVTEMPLTPITGKVFRDFNSDGQDSETTADRVITDPGVSGVIITAYDKNGSAVGSATSAADGTYTINPTAVGPYRVAFTHLPSGYEPTTHGSVNGTSTQFVTTAVAASNVNLGINQPCDYCQNDPLVAQSVWLSGDPLLGGTANGGPWWVAFNYSRTGSAANGFPYTLQGADVGALWAEAWQPSTKKLYTSAMVRRHTGLGPQGLGGIYRIDLTSGTATVQPFVDLDAAPFNINFGTLPSNAARGLPANVVDDSTDALAFAAVGKQGIGGIALTEDGNKLFVVNLNTRALIALDVTNGATPTTYTSYPIVGAPGAPTCTNGQLRPWAVKFYRGRGYVGAVCDAGAGGTTADLTGYVLAFDPANPTAGYTKVLTIPFMYTRWVLSPSASASVIAWSPWTDTWNPTEWRQGESTCPLGECLRPTPILMDIGFDRGGNLTVAVGDRAGFQLGYQNFQPDGSTPRVDILTRGDLLKACGDPTTGWTLENNGVCGAAVAQRNPSLIFDGPSYTVDYQGIGGKEFYQDDNIDFESLVGGVSMHLGRDETAYSALDVLEIFDNGMARVRSSDGYHLDQASQTYWDTGDPNDPASGGYMGKAAGVGDLEMLCDLPPLEIGNRVWDDFNTNGVQDPGEPGFSGLIVSLQGPTNTITTNTDANGLYYFNVSPNTAYTLTVTPPSGYNVTTANAAALGGVSATSNAAISDTIDSDAVLLNGKATIAYKTGSAGQNNHGLDFGFTLPPVLGKVEIVNTPPGSIQVTKQVVTTDGSSPNVSGNFTINLNCGAANISPSSTQTVAVGGTVTFSNIPAGALCTVTEVTTNLPAAPSGYTWGNAQISSARVTVVTQQTTPVTIQNTLVPQVPPTNVLTVTKTISGTGSGSFNISVTGPSGYISTTTISGGQTKVFTGLASGVYTVTETTPGVGWVAVYTATSGTGGSTHAVVTLQNANLATLPITPIAGRVFRDFNSDGQITADGTFTDTGVSGVTITAYDKHGNAVGNATSATDGTYTLAPTGAGPYRVAFNNLPSGYEPTRHGSDNGTSTQFVTTAAEASNVNLGINHPCDYCQNDPLVAQPVWLNGDPTAGGTANDRPWWVAFNYSRTGDAASGFPYTLQGADMGALWGEAWQPSTKQLYASAVVRRHAGLGPQGLGGIYRIDLTSGTATVQPFVDLDAAPFNLNFGTLPSNAGRGLLADVVTTNTDAAAFAAVGKQGIGGIALTEDGTKLFVVNLNTRTLLALDVTNGATPITYTAYALVGAPGAPTCTNGELRPWAVKFYRGRGYVGAVCDASAGGTTADLTGYVLAFDPANPAAGYTPVLTIPFMYTRSILPPPWRAAGLESVDGYLEHQ